MLYFSSSLCYTQAMNNKNLNTVDFKNNDFYFLYLKREHMDLGYTREKWQEHSFYEIMFTVEGESEYVIENRKYTVKKGDVLLIKPAAYHYKHRVIKKEVSIYCLGFLPEAISNGGLAETVFERGEHFAVGECSPIEDILSALRKKVSQTKNNLASFLKSAAEATILLLADLSEKNEKTPEIKNAAVQRMLNFINENLPEIRKVSDIAKATFFSDSYARTLFKKEMNIGIMEYVRNKKVLLAHRKIRHGKKPTEIYAECGFSNYPSFYRAYLSYLGYSPREQKV